jgi:thiol-disulfide isomerase/thioredoxin
MTFLLRLMVLCLALGLRAQTPPHPTAPLGTALPDFSLPGVDGRTHTRDSFREARIVAVVFTCNHCPTAQAYEERLQQLARDYQPKGVAIVAVNPNSPDAVRLDELGYTDVADDLASMKIRAQQRGFIFPYLDDGPTESFSRQLGPVATPHVFLFDTDRKLRYAGRIDDSENPARVTVSDTRLALDALLAGKEPPVTTTKVFGCSTKWADKAAGNQRWIEKVRQEPVKLEPISPQALGALVKAKSGKVRVINVWATWCGPCVSEFDELVETNLRFRHRDFELITLAAHEPAETDAVLKFLSKHHASTRNLIFSEPDKYKFIEALDPAWSGALPHTLVLGPEGEVLHRQTGEMDFLELRRRIVPALNRITPWPGMNTAQ